MSREITVTVARLDPESARWLLAMADTGPRRDAGLARLHELLVRIARSEVTRRSVSTLGPADHGTGHHWPVPRYRRQACPALLRVMASASQHSPVTRRNPVTGGPALTALAFGRYRAAPADAIPSPADHEFRAEGRRPAAAAPGYLRYGRERSGGKWH